MAQWKEIAGYEGMYLVSDEGVVISLPRTVKTGRAVTHRRQKQLKNFLRGREPKYAAVALTKDGETRRLSVHRIVAEAFIPNPDGLPEINHKDENPLNNRVENLEWCTRQYNIDYSKSKPVVQMKNGEKIAKFKSIKEAGRQTGIERSSINNVLTGWSKTAGGFQWAYCD